MKQEIKKKEGRIVLTSENSPELAKRIREASKKYMERNYNLYKALENK